VLTRKLADKMTELGGCPGDRQRSTQRLQASVGRG
jgi:hypothetical protein